MTKFIHVTFCCLSVECIGGLFSQLDAMR